jgi:peptidoglycan-associated lipoprotein
MKYHAARMLSLLMLVLVALAATGCRYGTNRYYDFRDTFHVGVGITAESSRSIIPPSLGVYAELTDWLHLGAITHNGLTAELDLRGTFVGPESTTRFGFLWWQMLRRNEVYSQAHYFNYFKYRNSPWCQRMEALDMRLKGRTAKELHYERWANQYSKGTALMHRGWQYWGYSGLEVAICEPFITHFGFMARAGVDFSEFSDFLLGWFTLDFKHDDLTVDEYNAKAGIDKKGAGGDGVGANPGAPGDGLPGDAAAERDLNEQLVPFPEMNIIYFDTDKYNIRPDQQPRAEANLKYLLEHPDVKVHIEGHCDERNTQEYNLNLGMNRAKAVQKYFIDNGVAAERIQIQSKGEEEPAALGHDESAWKQNRRDEFKRVVKITATN